MGLAVSKATETGVNAAKQLLSNAQHPDASAAGAKSRRATQEATAGPSKPTAHVTVDEAPAAGPAKSPRAGPSPRAKVANAVASAATNIVKPLQKKRGRPAKATNGAVPKTPKAAKTPKPAAAKTPAPVPELIVQGTAILPSFQVSPTPRMAPVAAEEPKAAAAKATKTPKAKMPKAKAPSTAKKAASKTPAKKAGSAKKGAPKGISGNSKALPAQKVGMKRVSSKAGSKSTRGKRAKAGGK